jgi:hypothetical protein
MELQKVEQLLNATHRIIAQQKENEKLRGEKFNVFSILQMERKENATHSAFLCELLNPKGSHLKGTVFLELFLQTIGDKTIDFKTAKVKPEHHVGKKDVLGKTGGRIDIYIWDKEGNSISIENKIDAGEQEAQLERYYNHNKSKNTVYYLTKYGVPSEECKDQLTVGKHYFLLSYKATITNWLQVCMKESFDSPILRETIKQYFILIKKLTQTMNEKEQKELFEAILNNYEEASIITSNFKSAVVPLNGNIRKKVFESLVEKLSVKYNVYLGSAIDKPHSQIWIKVSGKEEAKIFFGIQGFSVEKDDLGEGLIMGIFVLDGKYLPGYDVLGEKRSNWWIEIESIKDFDGYNVCLQDSKTLKKLNADQIFHEKFISHIVDETILYLGKHVESISAFLNDNPQ